MSVYTQREANSKARICIGRTIVSEARRRRVDIGIIRSASVRIEEKKQPSVWLQVIHAEEDK